LLCTHSQVDKVGLGLLKLDEGALGLHDEVAYQGGELYGWAIFGEVLDGDAVVVYKDVPDGSFLVHQCFQGVFNFLLFCVGLIRKINRRR